MNTNVAAKMNREGESERDESKSSSRKDEEEER